MKVDFPLVSIIVVNWNGGDVFRTCLSSLSKLSYPDWELVIVDNGSTDGSENYYKGFTSLSGKTKVIKNRRNLGFAPANNQGLKLAHGKYILLLNNDTRVKTNFLKSMITKMERGPSIGVMQPKIRMMDSPERLDNAGSFLTWTGFLHHWGFGSIDSPEFSREREVYSVKGACLLTKREVVDKLGLFDDRFVSYFEESDFCGRVWLAGWRVIYYPEESIYHKVGFTSKRLNQVEVNFHSLKNRIASYIKNFGVRGTLFITVPHLIVLVLLSIFYLVRLGYSKSFMVFKAFWWNIVNIKETLKERRLIQGKRKVSDKEILEWVAVGWKLSEQLKYFWVVEKNFERVSKFPDHGKIPEIGRLRACFEFLKGFKLRGKVLVDVGSSTGLLESKLKGLSLKRIVGIEPNQEAVIFAKKNVPNSTFFVGTADNLPIKSNAADVVTMFDVIEHVPKGGEVDALTEVYRVLKKGGMFLLSTPNSSSLTNLLDPAWYFGHRHYRPRKIKRMIEGVGLKIEQVEVKGSVWSSIYMLWFYIMKWIFGWQNPRNKWLESKEDQGYNQKGIFTVFVKATK